MKNSHRKIISKKSYNKITSKIYESKTYEMTTANKNDGKPQTPNKNDSVNPQTPNKKKKKDKKNKDEQSTPRTEAETPRAEQDQNEQTDEDRKFQELEMRRKDERIAELERKAQVSKSVIKQLRERSRSRRGRRKMNKANSSTRPQQSEKSSDISDITCSESETSTSAEDSSSSEPNSKDEKASKKSKKSKNKEVKKGERDEKDETESDVVLKRIPKYTGPPLSFCRWMKLAAAKYSYVDLMKGIEERISHGEALSNYLAIAGGIAEAKPAKRFKLIVSQYGDRHENMQIARQKLQGVKQGKKEKVEKFFERLDKVGKGTEVGEDDKIFILKSNARNPFKQVLVQDDPRRWADVHTAVIKAQQLETADNPNDDNSNPSKTGNSETVETANYAQDAHTCHNCGKPGHYARDCWSKGKGKGKSNGKGKGGGKGKGKNGYKGGYQPNQDYRYNTQIQSNYWHGDCNGNWSQGWQQQGGGGAAAYHAQQQTQHGQPHYSYQQQPNLSQNGYGYANVSIPPPPPLPPTLPPAPQ